MDLSFITNSKAKTDEEIDDVINEFYVKYDQWFSKRNLLYGHPNNESKKITDHWNKVEGSMFKLAGRNWMTVFWTRNAKQYSNLDVHYDVPKCICDDPEFVGELQCGVCQQTFKQFITSYL